MTAIKSRWAIGLAFIIIIALAYLLVRARWEHHSGLKTDSHDISFSYEVTWGGRLFEDRSFREDLHVKKRSWEAKLSRKDLSFDNLSGAQVMVTKDGNDVFALFNKELWHIDLVHQTDT